MKKFNNNYISIMFFSENNGKLFSIRLPKFFFHSIGIFLFIFFSGIIILLFKSGEISAKLQVISLLKTENEKLKKANSDLSKKSERVNVLYNLSIYLKRLSSFSLTEDINAKIVSKKYNNVKNITLSNDFIKDISLNANFYSLPNILPVEGWITRQFFMDSIGLNNGHLGIDIAAAHGTPIKSTAPGVVIKIENDKYFGLIITILHDNGYITRYGHCSQILVSKYDRIDRGQTIALVGNTGRSSAPHVHYEVIKDGKNVDPIKILFANKN